MPQLPASVTFPEKVGFNDATGFEVFNALIKLNLTFITKRNSHRDKSKMFYVKMVNLKSNDAYYL